jgi:hypothetical protein
VSLLPAVLTRELELALMHVANDRLEASEDPAVLGSELARVEGHRGDLALGDPDLDTPSARPRVLTVTAPDQPAPVDYRLIDGSR